MLSDPVTKMNEQPKQSDALKNLNFQKDCEEKVASSLGRGLEEWPGIYKKTLEDLKRQPINIGVTGSSGAGKSSWINSMCHFKRGSSDQYAETDVTECTREIKAYRHPEIGNIWFWDMPGVNTPNYPRDTYLKKVKFEQYDALILITKDRFTDDDLYLAKAAKDHGVPYYFVYSQFDLVILSAAIMDTDETEQDIKWKIEAKIKIELEKAELNSKKIYFLSNASKFRNKYDFPELEKQSMDDIAENITIKDSKLQASLQQICKDEIAKNCEKLKSFENLAVINWFVNIDGTFHQNIKRCLANIQQWIYEIMKIDNSMVEGIIGGMFGRSDDKLVKRVAAANMVAITTTAVTTGASVAGGPGCVVYVACGIVDGAVAALVGGGGAAGAASAIGAGAASAVGAGAASVVGAGAASVVGAGAASVVGAGAASVVGAGAASTLGSGVSSAVGFSAASTLGSSVASAVGAGGAGGGLVAVEVAAIASAAAVGTAALTGGSLVAGSCLGIAHLRNKKKRANLEEQILTEHQKIYDIIKKEAQKFEEQHLQV